MGQTASSCSDAGASGSKDLEEQRAVLEEAERLFMEAKVPRDLRDQVQNLLAGASVANDDDGATTLSLHGLNLSVHAAEYVAAVLRLVQQKEFHPSPAITTLAIEREFQTPAALDALTNYLRNQSQLLHSHHQVEKLEMSFCSFGAECGGARKNCRELLGANTAWRSLDFQHCNFSLEDMEEKDMSFITEAIKLQTALEEFKLSHGFLADTSSVGDAELAELVETLASKRATLRTLIMRDKYDGVGVSGQATCEALIELVETCQLEKLVWDIPCTHELYEEGSEMQQRFSEAMERNQTLQSVQLRRLSIHSALAKKIKECTQRNQNSLKVRQAFFTSPAETVGMSGVPVGAYPMSVNKNASTSSRRSKTTKKRVRFDADHDAVGATEADEGTGGFGEDLSDRTIFGRASNTRRVVFDPSPTLWEFDPDEVVAATEPDVARATGRQAERHSFPPCPSHPNKAKWNRNTWPPIQPKSELAARMSVQSAVQKLILAASTHRDLFLCH